MVSLSAWRKSVFFKLKKSAGADFNALGAGV